jgi:hypothetical protein
MGLESATYISQLTATNPTASDPVSQGDDHLRLIKSVLQSQFTTLGAAAVTTTAAELNLLDGVTAVGDASGPSSSTDNAIARFDGTGGKTLQNSSTTIDDNGDIVVGGTTPTITIGDGGAEDAALVYDGNAKDFYIGLDDTADKLVIGEGSAVGTNSILTITDDTVTIGDGAAVDTYLNFDGTAVDYRIGLDDGTDKLEIGAGVAHGSTTAIAIDSSADMVLGGYIDFQDELAIRPELKDYSETKVALSAAATVDIDLTTGNVFTLTPDQNTTFTFSNPSPTGKSCSFTLVWTQDSSDRTIAWPASVDWAGGSAPDVTSGSAKVDIYAFFTMDAGTIWYGFQPGADMG